LRGFVVAEFFIADMHFGSPYRSYAKPRGFASVEAMHEAIADAWRSRVTASDTVWVLGDVGDVGGLAELPGMKHLIFGNDDRPKRDYKESDLFMSLRDSHILDTKGGSILLVHRPKDAKIDGLRVLHGHTHAAPDEPDPRFVSVSVDKTGWGPISLDEVMRRFDARARSMAAKASSRC
jgi:calcineurin-like phosphoesterase family protein